MLFTQPAFLFLFLPLFLILAKVGSYLGPARIGLVLLLFSAVFYYSWSAGAFLLLLGQILVNYAIATVLQEPGRFEGKRGLLSRRAVLGLTIFANCVPLLWCKYADFLGSTIAYLMNTPFEAQGSPVPPGISFYTFIQIAWLVGIYKGSFTTEGIGRHALFSTFFPYILSGPIVRYEQIGTQLDRLRGPDCQSMALGLSLFSCGVAKKVLLADSLAPTVNAVFSAAEKGWPLSGVEAWIGSLAYSFQLYFDFSGYTDMAIAIGLMIGLQLPENFISPYKATGIIDFWRRWHITLGLWLRDFLYIPLGGNRFGKVRQYRNLFLTMLVGGAWHGAGWTFVLWGALHGLMLVINHAFRVVVKGTPAEDVLRRRPCAFFSILLTFFCLNVCWVLFRAETLTGALTVLQAMFTGPFVFPGFEDMIMALAPNHYIQHWYTLAVLGISAVLVWAFPCTHEIFTRKAESVPSWLRFRFSAAWAVFLTLLFLTGVLFVSGKPAFLYFQF